MKKSPFDVSADVSVVLVIVMQEVRSNATSSLCVCFFIGGTMCRTGRWQGFPNHLVIGFAFSELKGAKYGVP